MNGKQPANILLVVVTLLHYTVPYPTCAASQQSKDRK
jgi:hypothetical protein